jgi:hypothetical protein
MVVVIGADIVEELFPHQDPLGQEIKVIFRPFFNFGPGGEDEVVSRGPRDVEIRLVGEQGEVEADEDRDDVADPDARVIARAEVALESLARADV